MRCGRQWETEPRGIRAVLATAADDRSAALSVFAVAQTGVCADDGMRIGCVTRGVDRRTNTCRLRCLNDSACKCHQTWTCSRPEARLRLTIESQSETGRLPVTSIGIA